MKRSQLIATVVGSAMVSSVLIGGGLALPTGAAGVADPGGTLYFSRDGVSELYALDTTDGTATPIGTTGVTSSTVGLTEGPESGELLGSTWQDLTTIQADGSGFETAEQNQLDAEGLAFDPTSGILYRALNGAFSTADVTTGAPGPDLAAPGEDVEGLAWRDDGTILGLSYSSDHLLAYDIDTDAWSEVGSTGIANNEAWGLAWNPTLDVLYGVNGAGDLYVIDPDTADAMLIGNTGLGAGGGLAFLTSAPVPEATLVPGTPVGEAGGEVTFPAAGVCGDAAGNQVSLSISGPGGVSAGPVAATTGDDGTYEAELVVPAAPAGDYTITGTCTIVGGAELPLPDAAVVLGAAAEAPSEGAVPVPAPAPFTG